MCEKLAMAMNLVKKAEETLIKGCPYVDDLIDLEKRVSAICLSIKDFIKPSESGIGESLLQPQNLTFPEKTVDFDSLIGSIRSKSSGGEEAKEEKKKAIVKVDYRVSD